MTATIYPSWAHDRTIHGYWVEPGRLLAGEYPGSPHRERATEKIGVLTGAGVDSVVDLTQPGEPAGGGEPMKPYGHLLPEGIRYARFPIPDCGVIADDGYDEILAHLRAEIAEGRTVFVHCWGGKGRTGTVVGLWLIEEHGLDYDGLLDRFRELRRGTRKAHHSVPDTPGQHRALRRRAQVKVVGQ